MRTLIILPGNSPKNKEWGEGIAKAFGGLFDTVYQQSYTHWATGEETINFDHELEKLRTVIMNETKTDVQYYIFAKSFGALLALMSVYRGFITPKQCVFFGLPFNLARDHDIFKGEWAPLTSFKIPSLAFHNDNDYVAHHAYTAEKLVSIPSIELVTTKGDDHGYFEFKSYKERIKAFLSL